MRAIVERIVESGVVTTGLLSDAKDELAYPADSFDHTVARQYAADIGTACHNRIDCFIRGKPFDPKPYVSETVPDPMAASEAGFSAFLEWVKSSSVELVEGEKPMVSEHHQYGGTPDCLMVKGKKVVGDFKTGDIYPEQVLPQLAAYRTLFVENGHDVQNEGHVLSINRKTGGFIHRYFTEEEMTRGMETFVCMRLLYDMVGKLK